MKYKRKAFSALLATTIIVSTFNFIGPVTAEANDDSAVYYTTYWNDFEDQIWESKAIGTGIIAEGGTSGATLTQESDGENKFMLVNASSGGSYRVSKLDLPTDALSGAEVTFDWKPISAQNSNSRFGDIAFISSGSTYSYFGLQFNKNKEITYYTKGENIAPGWGITYSDEVLEGEIIRNSSFASGLAAEYEHHRGRQYLVHRTSII